MNREQILEIIKLLSALEAWSFSNGHRLPDYLMESLDNAVKALGEELLK